MTHHDVIVIGAGQAGLAIGHHLAQQRRDFVILEADDGPAAAWRARWDSLRLFTPARYDSLPGTPFPGDPDHHPTRDEVVAYLTDYARALPIQCRSRVDALQATDDGYALALGDRTVRADQVVVATGPFQTPRVPALSGRLDPRIRQLHSAGYRNPQQIGAGPVLVVGGGNTGYGQRLVHLLERAGGAFLAAMAKQHDVSLSLTAVRALRAVVLDRRHAPCTEWAAKFTPRRRGRAGPPLSRSCLERSVVRSVGAVARARQLRSYRPRLRAASGRARPRRSRA